MTDLTQGKAKLDDLSEEELADYLYEHRDDESLWTGKFVPLTPAKAGEGLVWSMRISAEDLHEISTAAFANGGTNVSEFFRSAALEKARALSGLEPPTTPQMLKKKLAEAQKLVDELAKLIPPETQQRVAEPRQRYGTRRRKKD
jgi:hypothetical protein